jgi:hydroxylamine reductase
VPYIEARSGKKDFSDVIAKAKSLGGFAEDNKEKDITVGFAHNAVLGAAGR